MKIKMKTTQYGSEDGFVVKLFNTGEIYEVAENLGSYFIKWGMAEWVK